MKTDGHLFHDQNHFSLKNIGLEYALEKIVAETYSLQLVLPDGAENVRIKIDNALFDMSQV